MAARFIVALLLLACLPLAARGQCQEAKLLPSTVEQGAQFGHSVALEGTTAVVGADTEDTVAGNAGAAYVFQLDASGWREIQKLPTPPLQVGAAFGWSVAISGDWIAVGATNDHAQGQLGSGSAFMFQRQGSTWVQTQKLWASDVKADANFAWSLALAGDVLVAGAREDWTNGSNAGAAYVFELQGSTWTQAAKLLPSAPQVGATFGASVAVNGQLALVGAPNQDWPGLNTGVAFLYERTAGGWVEQQILAPSNWGGQLAGGSVALLDEVAFIGARGYGGGALNNQGACYVFRNISGSWSQTQRLLASDPEFNLQMGDPLTVHGRHLLAGALVDNDQGDTSGSVYHFEDLGTSYVQVGKLLANDGKAIDFFGRSVALWGDTAFVGAERTDEACPTNIACDSGSAYVFRISSDVVQFCSCASSAPCGNPDDFGGCANSTGQGAVLSACGSTSVVLDELALQGRWLPPNAFALLFTGGTFTSNPFGDGSLCVHPGATGIHRFAVTVTDGGGTVQYGPGLAALSQAFPPAGQIQPGDVRYFQMWYRDPAGPCGSAVNLTNALRVRFQP